MPLQIHAVASEDGSVVVAIGRRSVRYTQEDAGFLLEELQELATFDPDDLLETGLFINVSLVPTIVLYEDWQKKERVFASMSRAEAETLTERLAEALDEELVT